ncbi:hypothetical protein [uncultured Roseobacter sp.]|uniref:hypothetical protein n=1 Tax=uncultured Roseobacter sp. TaxID=114847 RepID=UPI00262910DD|nr:hypothetical protein [uncultured Roseobacter sp.]
MSEKFKRFEKALDALIDEGTQLHMAMQLDCYGEPFFDKAKEQLSKKKADALIKDLPNFNDRYQGWYSEAQALVKQVLPERLSDFQSYYEFPRVRKDITFQNYMIKDYLQGLRITRGWEKEVVADGSSAVPEFVQQLNIVKAVS